MPNKRGVQPSVGYGRPPVASQFQPGKSGNAAGRPKGTPTAQDLIAREARRHVKLRTSKGITEISKLEAVVRMLYGKAIEGDLAAARLILQVMTPPGNAAAEISAAEVIDPTTIDDETVKRMLARFEGVAFKDRP